jgi:uncharacterized membrane protein YesL
MGSLPLASWAERVELDQQLRVPEAPRLSRALREAGLDFYFNSWRLLPANGIWGLGLVAILVVPVGLIIAVALLSLLAIPTAGIYRMAALIARGDSVSLWDGLRAYRDHLGTALVMGVATMLLLAVLVFNVVNGLSQGTFVGFALATAAGWGLVFLVIFLVTAWPVLIDPRREDLTVRQRLRLAVLLMLAHPLRVGALAAVVVIITVVSTILFAALVTVSVAYVALLSCRYVLPAADRLEGRATVPVEG